MGQRRPAQVRPSLPGGTPHRCAGLLALPIAPRKAAAVEAPGHPFSDLSPSPAQVRQPHRPLCPRGPAEPGMERGAGG